MKRIQEVFNETNTIDSIEDTPVSETRTEEAFPDYMISDSLTVGYETEDLQNLIYSSAIVGTVHPDVTSTVLDVGCGRGDFGRYLLMDMNCQKIKYTGIDSNPLMIEVGKYKYDFLIEESNSEFFEFALKSEVFDENYDETTKYDWVFHNTNITMNYGNIQTDQYEYLEMMIRKSLNICNVGSVFMLLPETSNNNESDYIFYKRSRIVEIINAIGVPYAIDCTDSTSFFKLILLK